MPNRLKLPTFVVLLGPRELLCRILTSYVLASEIIIAPLMAAIETGMQLIVLEQLERREKWLPRIRCGLVLFELLMDCLLGYDAKLIIKAEARKAGLILEGVKSVLLRNSHLAHLQLLLHVLGLLQLKLP